MKTKTPTPKRLKNKMGRKPRRAPIRDFVIGPKKVKPLKYGQNLTNLFAYLTKHRKKIGHIALCVEARDGEQMPSRVNPKNACGDGFVFIGDGWDRVTEVERAMVSRLAADVLKNVEAPY